ncbi:Brix domain-containing protein [Lipomyces kononenkoae]|uniref:Brix domain-containing protein n=1 Tax=Lipomyces kononenkoae TaxID=34357 RepID=A0ACC3T6E8_LIPKO
MASLYKAVSGTKRRRDDDQADKNVSSGPKNRQRVLMLSSRGVTYRQRHLINDLAIMLPHAKKDSKFDTKSKLFMLNELADLYNCNNILFFEARKRQDLYLYLAKAPNGPTAKFHIQNLHTMSELNFTGNCLRGSRPILSFDKTFDGSPHYRLVKELMFHIFGVPRTARKAKPFVDHVIMFSIVDNKVWFRNYQISEAIDTAGSEGSTAVEAESAKTSSSSKKKQLTLSLVEIGPRFVMTLISIVEGSFSGPLIYENKEFVSPNFVRAQYKMGKAALKNKRADKIEMKKVQKVVKAKERKEKGPDPLTDSLLFA